VITLAPAKLIKKEQHLLFFLVTRIGRVGAINLEQLDLLLYSLKTYWDYINQKSFLDEIKAPMTKAISAENELIYEL
jgi:hypothetical protein